jgi:maltose 6'-phosphate phosphatase
MKTSDYLKCAILLSVFLFTACQCKPPIDGDAQCDDLAKNGYVSILDLNIEWVREVNNEEPKLRQIADFVAKNHVDFVLLQEVTSRTITGRKNSATELRKILLKKHNMRYNVTAAEDIVSWGNAILSRCEITRTDKKNLYTRGNPNKDKWALSRNVLLAVVSIPGYGNVNIYDTHLCSSDCGLTGRKLELDIALSWIKETTSGSRLAIIGGDFNFDRFVNAGSEAFMWQKIIDAGFKDAYADYMEKHGVDLDFLCENECKPDEHCTKGVTKRDKKNGRRIDYIFTNTSHTIKDAREDARVVFNEMINPDEATVSDHAGVFILLKLP